MTDGPTVAVVVSAFGRDEFVRPAVRSVVGQTVPRASYEVVVVRNFRTPTLDRELADLGVVSVDSSRYDIGAFQHDGVRATTAPWIAFLDDDDEFEPERLARFFQVARDRPELGFYRNRVRVIDRDGRPVPTHAWRRHEVDAGFDALGPVYLPPGAGARALEVGLDRTWATFNSSTMIVRRELLEGDLGAAFDRQRLPDTLLYLAAVVRRRGIFLDPARLTRFRYWGESATGTLRWFGHASRCNAELAEVAARYDEAEFARRFRGLAVHYRRMEQATALAQQIAEGGGRHEVARRAAAYLRYLGDNPEERQFTLDTWAAGIYGLGYALAPGAVRRLARARLTRGRGR